MMETARAVEASGVVDELMFSDAISGWFPASLYTPEHAPTAAVIPDSDSFHDAFLLAAFAAAASTNLGISVTTDSVRRPPAELVMAMHTLAGATEGRATLMIGAGEAKHLRPLGFRRSEGLTRLEDFFRVREQFAQADAPFDFDGHHWTMRSAWIGVSRPHAPAVWAMGGGSRLIDMATRYADGFSSVMPQVFPRPDEWAAQVESIKRELERLGRDPEAFDFGLWVPALLHEDEEQIEAAFQNPLVRFLAAVFGRLDQKDWAREGIESVFPSDWHYALRFIPADFDGRAADDVVARTPKEMVAKSFAWGDPKCVAEQILPFVEAGATHVAVLDLMKVLLPPAEAAAAINRSLEFCRLLKQSVA
jgi:phthiodiolone/phenolphthiodiolone dimycocerosates ketoreductase